MLVARGTDIVVMNCGGCGGWKMRANGLHQIMEGRIPFIRTTGICRGERGRVNE